jgi:hypothetical protein
MFGSPGNTGPPEGDQYVGELQTAIEGAHRVARETLKQSQKRMKRDYDIFEAPLLLVISCPLNDLLTQFLSPLWNFPVLT